MATSFVCSPKPRNVFFTVLLAMMFPNSMDAPWGMQANLNAKLQLSRLFFVIESKATHVFHYLEYGSSFVCNNSKATDCHLL
jgi:hypothetical protein